MTTQTKSPKQLDNPPVPARAKIAAAWTSLMFQQKVPSLHCLLTPKELHPLREKTGHWMLARGFELGIVLAHLVYHLGCVW